MALLTLSVLYLGTSCMAHNSTDSYLGPKDNNPSNPLEYIASNTLTAVAICMYPISSWSVFSVLIMSSYTAIVLTTALIHMFWCLRYRTKSMLALVIGEYCEFLDQLLSVKFIGVSRLRYRVRFSIRTALLSRFQKNLYCRVPLHCTFRRCTCTSSTRRA